MKKLLIVNGSPREGSSTEILAERCAAGFTSVYADAEVNAVRLNELDIIPCQACGFSPAPLPCIFKDDLYPWLLKLREADALLIAGPVYFDSVSAQTKLFIDRTNCFRPPIFDGSAMRFDKSQLLDSRGALILVGGERQKFDAAELVIGGMFVWCGIKKAGKLLYAHSLTDLGSVSGNREVLEEAFQLGRRLASA